MKTFVSEWYKEEKEVEFRSEKLSLNVEQGSYDRFCTWKYEFSKRHKDMVKTVDFNGNAHNVPGNWYFNEDPELLSWSVQFQPKNPRNP